LNVNKSFELHLLEKDLEKKSSILKNDLQREKSKKRIERD